MCLRAQRPRACAAWHAMPAPAHNTTDLRCLRGVQMTIFRLTLDEDVFNSLKRAGDVSFKMGADGQHILRVGKKVCKRVREQSADGVPASATIPVPGSSH